MKLSEYLLQGTPLFKKAKLTKSIKLDNGEKRKKGTIVSIIKQNPDGTYHAEDNGFACLLEKEDFEYIK